MDSVKCVQRALRPSITTDLAVTISNTNRIQEVIPMQSDRKNTTPHFSQAGKEPRDYLQPINYTLLGVSDSLNLLLNLLCAFFGLLDYLAGGCRTENLRVLTRTLAIW